MEYSRDLHIEVDLEDVISNYREVYWRIVPHELPLFKRLFCNPWRRFYYGLASLTGTNYEFSRDRYNSEIVGKIKTYGDVCDYLKKQDEIIECSNKRWEELKNEKIKNHENWPVW